MNNRLYFLLAAIIGYSAFLIYSKSPGKIPEPLDLIPGRNGTVLFASNFEKGLANVVLASASALIEEYPDLDVHYVGYPGFRKDVDRVSSFATQRMQDTRPITFHSLRSVSAGDAIGGKTCEELFGPPGLKGFSKTIDDIEFYAMARPVEQHIKLIEEVSAIIDEIDPSLVVIEALMGPVIDATVQKRRKYAIVLANSLENHFSLKQPWLSGLWKYPIVSSGFAFPVPWHLIPTNIYMVARLAYRLGTLPAMEEKKKRLNEYGVVEPATVMTAYQDGVQFFAPSLGEYPTPFIPPNATRCNVMSLASAPLHGMDPNLSAWLGKRETVLINLGSIYTYTEHDAMGMAQAIKSLVSWSDVLVVWKMKKRGQFLDDYLEVLASEIADDRVRVETWFQADPLSILEGANIVASVHHGGANCFYEALGAGVPQIVLPMWLDCYDLAARAEWLEVGVWANKKSAPSWSAEELDIAFRRVVGKGEEAKSMRAKAAEVAEPQKKKPGRYIAAKKMAEMAIVP